jgi:hypothetical protein
MNMDNSMIRKKLVLLLLFASLSSGDAQWKSKQAPRYLADEIFRLSKDCYYFKEYLLFKQSGKRYVIAAFVNRETIGTNEQAFPKPVSKCGKRIHQIRLYRYISEKKSVLKDSLFIDKFDISLGNASDFDQSGTTKLIVNHRCNPPQREAAPLLCYAFSIYEVTKLEKLRNVLSIGNVPERYSGGQPQGIPLEPVVTDNFDKTPFPECLAIDDFFEGDPAFRADDFPKVTLVYAWDYSAKAYKHHSDKFVHRFSLPFSLDSIPENIHLVEFMQNVMSLASVGRQEQAMKYADAGLISERVERWKIRDPLRAKHIELEALRSKLLICIRRYQTSP